VYNGAKSLSGFNKPSAVPATIVSFLGLDMGVELPRTQITKLIYGYIKDNKLQDEEDKRTIKPDTKLRHLFTLNETDQISFYNIQSHIKKLYTQPPVAEPASEPTPVVFSLASAGAAAAVEEVKKPKKEKKKDGGK